MGWICSSEGFEVRVMGRNDVQYRDAAHELHLFAEFMSKPANEAVLSDGSIPDTPDLPRAVVVDRLKRAFTARGWNLLVASELEPW
jgi:hypothetical protein